MSHTEKDDKRFKPLKKKVKKPRADDLVRGGHHNLLREALEEVEKDAEEHD